MSKKHDNQACTRKKRRERLRRLKAKKAALAQMPGPADVLPPDVKFVGAIPGMPKMSDQLAAFVEPYISSVNSDDAYHELLSIGMVAWNLALVPPGEREELLAPFLKSFGGADSRAERDFLEIVGALIKRKETEPAFAKDDRYIANFSLTERPSGPYPQVASLLPS